MPWSDWQISPTFQEKSIPHVDGTPVSSSAHVTGGPGSAIDGLIETARQVAVAAPDPIEGSEGSGTSSGILAIGEKDTRAGVTSTSADVILTSSVINFDATEYFASLGHDDLNWSPPFLDTLTEGVDYVVRPDRRPGDIDQFVEYSSNHFTFGGWAEYEALLQWFVEWTQSISIPPGHPPLPASRPASIPLQVRLTAVAGGIPPGTWPIVAGTDLGEFIFDFPLTYTLSSLGEDGLGGGPEPILITPFDMPLAWGLSVWNQFFVDPLSTTYAPDIPFIANSNSQYSLLVNVVFDSIRSPFVIVHPPTWRYYIPDPPSAGPEPPLRLGQRNDGLGPNGHARLNSKTSTQLGSSARIGTGNVYS